MWKFKVHLVKIQVHVYLLWINLHKLFQFNLLCAVESYSNKPNLTTIFSSFLYFMNIDWNSVLKVLGNRLKQGKKTRILATYQACHLIYQLKISSKSHTIKLRVLTRLVLEAHSGFFRLLMKWIFDPYVLWPFVTILVYGKVGD